VCFSAGLPHHFDDGLSVVAAVGDERVRRWQTLDQGRHGRLVGCLAGGQDDPER
jgi:hypothetical protein